MKSISIRDLHLETGKYVRRALKESFTITDHGREIAVLSPIKPACKPLPRRKNLPVSSLDSTAIVVEDRNGL